MALYLSHEINAEISLIDLLLDHDVHHREFVWRDRMRKNDRAAFS